jgi:hypothetical protein
VAGDEGDTLFWDENLASRGALRNRFGSLFSLSLDKEIRVLDFTRVVDRR